MNVLGQRLRQLRDVNALTQGQVAVYAGVAQTSYSALERGLVYPKTVDAIVDLARFYEVSADYLLGLTDDPTPVGRAETPPPYALEMADAMRRLGPLQSERLCIMARAWAEHEEERRRNQAERVALLDALAQRIGGENASTIDALLTEAVAADDDGASLDRLLWFIANQAQEPPQAE
jgi:transcriptional regulator with XRE-family HTH domain